MCEKTIRCDSYEMNRSAECVRCAEEIINPWSRDAPCTELFDNDVPINVNSERCFICNTCASRKSCAKCGVSLINKPTSRLPHGWDTLPMSMWTENFSDSTTSGFVPAASNVIHRKCAGRVRALLSAKKKEEEKQTGKGGAGPRATFRTR